MADRFDKEFVALLSQCRETVDQWRQVTHSEKSKCNARVYLEKYTKIYNKTDPEEHYHYIRIFYIENRDKILGFEKNIHWPALATKIRYGKGVLDDGDKIKAYSILVPDIYKMALDLKDKKSDLSLPKDSIRAEIINYHLSRLCCIIAELFFQDDVRILETLVSRLEKELRGPTDDSTPSDPAFGGIMDMAMNLLDSAGFSTEGMNKPTEQELQCMIRGVCENPAVKNMITSVASIMRESKNPTEELPKLISSSLSAENIASLTKVAKKQ
jgi:hypothetical protein